MQKPNRGDELNAVIFRAGPAGLAAASKPTDYNQSVAVFEQEDRGGGICKTKEYNGYRFDLWGRRFFTKSDVVNALWGKPLGKEFLKRPRLSRF
jgi:phytoene dehydrogenase-like protein